MVRESEIDEAMDAYWATFDDMPPWLLELPDEEFVSTVNAAVESGVPLPMELESERRLREEAEKAIHGYMEAFGCIPWGFRMGMSYERIIEITDEALRTKKRYVEEYKEGCVY